MPKQIEIVEQQIQVDDKNRCSLVTRYSDGSIGSEPVTSEQAAQWQAEHKF